MRRTLLAALGGTLLLTGCRPSAVPAGAAPVDTPPFREVARAAGLRYAWTIPDQRPLNILQTIGNGCAFLDFDSDGNLDILLVGPKPALYRGDGKGKFADESSRLGSLSGHFLGCAVGDIDNDGFPDLYLTAYRGGALLHNEAGKAFRAVPSAPQPWATSAAFVETRPGSGRLDLVVANYAHFQNQAGIPQLCEQKGVNGESILTSCGPRQYTPLKAVLFRGGGESPATLAMVSGRGLGVAACDYDGSGRPGIAFANDEAAGDLLQNRGGGAFVNVGITSGTAFDRDGNVHGGMGLDWGDYDNDGRFDLFVATFQNEAKSLYRNGGAGLFTDESYPSGIGSLARPHVAFGSKFLDWDNDGWLDLAIANGHVQDNIARIDPSTTYRQTVQLCRNRGKGAFEEVGAALPAIVGRGLASGDYDNDGRIDLLVVDSEGAPLLLHNEAPGAGHWIGLKLHGVRSNRDGYGAMVTLETGGRRLVRHCHADGSYMSSSDPRIHFGIGSATTIERITIRWPDGATDRLEAPAIDRYHAVTEGRP